ncbi:hypothetical protein AXJ18_gp048 [Streptomyces phage Jay2Jay]|uniref:Uncharacterized protein n=2 Tax=Samistivirus jay2jay TaxID=2560786 RepID=A0A0A0RL79_9CAUD|nr:hypothetical protein AXJ18_gp018 [Streptomyces phage Jay2Jay]YP_009225953.1 hypothetical protein AXJ18_gp048 [Streptomyces phage Jay2Jay]ASN73093.1 hypothetical protein SEA_WARPY_18 [Streptomyces phage Warpy]AIW02517.1 hypothetical protein PBI_JAY2JAY_18 [Streptomyces phage Jay2Jay]AIW02726.1 hypothetical protein PBI_JAY2JAY_273 [Streptomyces phage Jay2Jay]ASN73300.1 hypothetical protein SEA_WARPY_270 [Streptomyces phage Warpy]
MGVKVSLYFHGRKDTLVAYLENTSVDELTTAWNDSVWREGLFVMTDRNGARLSINTDRVELFVVAPWSLT